MPRQLIVAAAYLWVVLVLVRPSGLTAGTTTMRRLSTVEDSDVSEAVRYAVLTRSQVDRSWKSGTSASSMSMCFITECKARLALEYGEDLYQLEEELRSRKLCSDLVSWLPHSQPAAQKLLLVSVSNGTSESSSHWVCRPKGASGALIGVAFRLPDGSASCAYANGAQGNGGVGLTSSSKVSSTASFDSLYWTHDLTKKGIQSSGEGTAKDVLGLTARLLSDDDRAMIARITGRPFAALAAAVGKLPDADAARVLSISKFIKLDALNALGLHLLRVLLAERAADARARAHGLDQHEVSSTEKACNFFNNHDHFGFDCAAFWTMRLMRTACLHGIRGKRHCS